MLSVRREECTTLFANQSLMQMHLFVLSTSPSTFPSRQCGLKWLKWFAAEPNNVPSHEAFTAFTANLSHGTFGRAGRVSLGTGRCVTSIMLQISRVFSCCRVDNVEAPFILHLARSICTGSRHVPLFSAFSFLSSRLVYISATIISAFHCNKCGIFNAKNWSL